MLLSAVLAGCIDPPPRDVERDLEMSRSTMLKPIQRGPVDDRNRSNDDPPKPLLKRDVMLLSSETPLYRIQADNRLKQAGAQGILAAADFLLDSGALDVQLVEAIRFITSADFSQLEPEHQTTLREALAYALTHEADSVRVEAARALQVHGPGSKRTDLLKAMGDPAKRVRWAVVRRFGDHPEELDEAQRRYLLTFLESGTREEFNVRDTDGDEKVMQREFTGTASDFDKLDRNGDGAISLEEWISPVSTGIRSDVYALLLRLHTALTPDIEPAGYNPWLPSADQLTSVAKWQAWNQEVGDKKKPEEEG